MIINAVIIKIMPIVHQCLFAIFGSIYCINKTPFLFFAIFSCALLNYIYFNAKISENWKVVVFNIAVIMLIFSFIEGWSIFKDRVFDKKLIGCVLYRPDSVRGYCPRSDQRAPLKCLQNGRVLYDVVYTTNRFGLRVAPHDIQPVQIDSNVRRVLFFGCSFTFGEGVNDNETLPFVFENNSHGKYWAYNFGIPGSGPHQMLALLESGTLDHVLEGQRPVAAIYQALSGHIQRVAFKDYSRALHISWGPEYFLDSSNKLLLKKKSVTQSSSLLGILNKSFSFHDFLSILSLQKSEADRKLFIEIVKRSKEIFESKYGGKFYVIYWDWGDWDDQVTIEALRRERIQVIPVSNILEKYKKNIEKYHLEEGHPNKFAYQILAQYLLNENF